MNIIRNHDSFMKNFAVLLNATHTAISQPTNQPTTFKVVLRKLTELRVATFLTGDFE